MAIFYTFSILFVTAITIEMWAFGKWIAKQNHIFDSHPLNSLLLGAVVWFTVTFLTFFPFVWINLGSIYYLTIFFVKEVVSWFFLAARSEDWIVKKGTKELGIMFIGGILLTIINHYGLSHYTNTTFATLKGDFNTWMILVQILGDMSNVTNNLVLAWPLAFLSGILIYSIVSTFIIMLSKRITMFEYIFSFMLTIVCVLLLSNGKDFATSLGSWFGVFAFYLATQVILKSRRRFAVFFAITFIASWSIDPSVFVAYTALAIVTTIVYTFLKKSKVYLFWVQLVAPIAVVGSLLVYEYSPIGAIFMVIVTVLAYTFMLTYVKTQVHAKLNKWFIKSRLILPGIIFASTFIAGLLIIIREDFGIGDFFIFKHGLFDNWYGGDVWNIIGITMASVIVALLMIYQWYWKIMKKKMIEHRIIILLASSLILLAYNPFFEISFIRSWSLSGFSILRNITIIPIVIAIANKIKFNTWTKIIQDRHTEKTL